MRQLRVPNVGLAPDLVRLLGANERERDRAHRRDRRDLDEPLGLGMAQLSRDARNRIESRRQQAGGAVGSGVLGHPSIFAAASDGPAHGTVSRAQTFSSRRSTAGSPSEAPKLITPAANTFAPAGVS